MRHWLSMAELELVLDRFTGAFDAIFRRKGRFSMVSRVVFRRSQEVQGNPIAAPAI
jgi:hypothetical protein